MSEAEPRAAAQETAAKKRFSPPRSRPLELRYILFLLLLVPGIIPLLISANFLVGKNKALLKDQQTELLTRFAQGFADLLSDDLARHRVEFLQLGRGLVAAPGFGTPEQRLQEQWVTDYLDQFFAEHKGEMMAFRVIDQEGKGPGTGDVSEAVDEALREVFAEALASGETVYRFTSLPQAVIPAVAIAVPVESPGSGGPVVVQGLFRLPFDSNSLDLDEMFLIDGTGQLLWTSDAHPEIRDALLVSQVVQDFAQAPLSVTSESEIEVQGKKLSILARVAPVEETGWGVVAHKETRQAFEVVQAMVQGIILSSVPGGGPGVRLRGARHRLVQPADPAPRRSQPRDRRRPLRPPGADHRRHARGRQAGGRLQPHERHHRELHRAPAAGGGGQSGAVHLEDPRFRGGDRRQGPLHPRPLGARGALQSGDLALSRPAQGHAGEGVDLGGAPRRWQDRRRRQGAAQDGHPDRRRVRQDEAASGDRGRHRGADLGPARDAPRHPLAPRGVERGGLSGRPQERADPADGAGDRMASRASRSR